MVWRWPASADGGIELDRDVTVAAASTLNAATADFAQFFMGSTAATGAFNSNSKRHCQPGDREQRAARGAAGALRPGGTVALRPRRHQRRFGG